MTYTGLENYSDNELIKMTDMNAKTPLELELAKRLDDRNEELKDWEKYEAELDWRAPPRTGRRVFK